MHVVQTSFIPDRPARDPQPADNLILWLPVFLLIGIASYFAIPFEPAQWWGVSGIFLTFLAGLTSFRWRYHPLWRWLVVFVAAFSIGFTLIQSRTSSMTAPLLDRRIWNGEVTGTIHSFERAGAGWRLVLHGAKIEQDPKSYTLRLTLRKKGFVPQMGGMLHARAGIMPPSSPLVPHSYDFRRNAFYDGIGGYGYITRILDYQPPDATNEKDYLEIYRDWLTDRVYAVLKQPEAGIVTAMLNGQRAGISRQTTNVLQQSGLQHVISISGLHVGLMAITIFYLSRLLMACSMYLALHYPIKKIAAGLALAGIIFYLLIVGNSPPTLRSVIMSGIALLAIMLDREPIQMRVVALSGILILVLQPESVTDIGFQMSFAAVIGMVAFFQQTKPFWTHQRWQDSILLKGVRAVLMIVATSVIATVITAPLVILYFQQIPLLSMLSNVMATIPVSFLIMPGTFLAYLFTPFPFLGDMAIHIMGWGVWGMMEVAYFVAKLPSAVMRATPIPLSSVCLVMLGVYAVIVIKNRWRWSGLVFVMIGMMIVPLKPQPDLFLMHSRVILYPEQGGSHLYIEGRLGGFEKNMMLQWTGKKKVLPLVCDADICDFPIRGKTVRVIRTVEALPKGCDPSVQMIITRYYFNHRCKGVLVIDRHDLDRSGGQAIFLGRAKDRIRVETVLSGGVRRPWHAPTMIDKRYAGR